MSGRIVYRNSRSKTFTPKDSAGKWSPSGGIVKTDDGQGQQGIVEAPAKRGGEARAREVLSQKAAEQPAG